MDFKTHSEENGTKSFKKLDEAFEYAEEADDVESISFVLPTDEKVVLTRSLTGWEYDPFDSEQLSDFEATVLKYCASEGSDMAPEEYWDTMDDLAERGFLKEDEAKSTTETEWLDIANRGI